ncbi:18468_t:CDS:2, partial [Gigaspora rosea]
LKESSKQIKGRKTCQKQKKESHRQEKNVKGCNKRSSNKIEVRKKELTERHKTFEPACNAWVMKVDSFKTQIKALEDKNQKDSINKEDLNKACRSWISKVKNIIVIPKKEQKKHVDTLPSNITDRIPSKNMKLKLYYERYQKINNVHKVVEEPKKPSIKE